MPVTVQGPDGQQYSFPDGTDKTAAIAYFKKKGISAPAAPQERPGFFKRLGQGLGVPTSKEELTSRPTADEMILGPGPRLAYNNFRNFEQAGQNAKQELVDAAKNVRAGQPVVPNVGKAVGALTEFGLRGPLGPFGGSAAQTAGEDVAAKNYPGAAGGALASIINALTLKKATSGVSDEAAVNKLSYASGKGATHPLQVALEDLQKTVSEVGPPKTVGDFLDVVNKTKDRMNTEAGAAMLPIAGQKIVPTAISQKIRALITPNMRQTALGRQQQKMLIAAATEFEKPWSYRQLDIERVDARARLRLFKKKNPVEQYSAAKAARSVAIDNAINEAIRDTIYPAMDKAAGKPSGYFGALKGRQSQLIDLQSTLTDRVEDLKDLSARSKGAPRIGSENVSLYGHPGGGIGASMHRLQDLIYRPDLEASANKRVQQAFSSHPLAKAYIYSLPVRYLQQMPNDQ